MSQSICGSLNIPTQNSALNNDYENVILKDFAILHCRIFKTSDGKTISQHSKKVKYKCFFCIKRMFTDIALVSIIK